MKAIVIPFNDRPILVDILEREPRETLTDLQRYVDGPIQIVPTPFNSQLTMYVNEEGKNRDLPLNERATQLVKSVLADDDYIAGNAVLLGAVDSMGYDTPIPQHFVDLLVSPSTGSDLGGELSPKVYEVKTALEDGGSYSHMHFYADDLPHAVALATETKDENENIISVREIKGS